MLGKFNAVNWTESIASLTGGRARNKIDWSRLPLFIIALFIGRASLMGEVNIFALIFWALMMRLYPEKRFLVTFAVLAGWFTLEAGFFPPWSLPAAMLLWKVLDMAAARFFKKELPLAVTLLPAVAVLRLPFLYIHGFAVYATIITLMEIALSAVLPPLLRPLLEALRVKQRGRPSAEVVVGALLLLSIVFLGMNDLVVFSGIAAVNIVCPLLILVGAYLWGPVWGVVIGIVTGLCLSFSSPDLFIYTGVLGTAGLAAGLLRSYRRPWGAGGYFAVLRFLSYYGLEGGYVLTSLWEELIVVTIFLLVPFHYWEKLRQWNILWFLKLDGEEKLRLTMASRVKEFAAVFRELAVTFRPLGAEEAVSSRRDLTLLVDFFSKRVCHQCEYFSRCWENDFRSHYRSVLTMISSLEEGAKFSEKMIPVKLKHYCPRHREIIRTMGSMKDIYHLNCYWQDKINESRRLVSRQLEGVSEVMHDLTQELKLETGEKNNQPEGIGRFIVEIGVAQIARDGQNISGDCYAVIPLREGRQAVLLSDGMGCGREARLASRSTVKLMEHLLKAGFRREMVIDTINTLLRLRYPAEKFATLDLALMDLQEGEVELYKLGAPPSFLKKGEMIRTIGSGSLPIGILEDIAPEKESIKVPSGGTLVMITDGFLNGSLGNQEDWLKNALQNIRHDHPQIIADRLIEEACNLSAQGVRDDLTVLVCHLKPVA